MSKPGTQPTSARGAASSITRDGTKDQPQVVNAVGGTCGDRLVHVSGARGRIAFIGGAPDRHACCARRSRHRQLFATQHYAGDPPSTATAIAEFKVGRCDCRLIALRLRARSAPFRMGTDRQD